MVPASARAFSREVERLVNEGRFLDALSALRELQVQEPCPAVEAQLVDLRHRAFAELERTTASSWSPPMAGGGQVACPVEVEAADLDLGTLRDGLNRSGCLLVRGLLDAATAADLAGGIDRALAAYDAAEDGRPVAETTPWYRPFRPHGTGYRVGGRRSWVRASGGLWTADSPRMLQRLVDLVEEVGIVDLVTAHLGERPVLSANKCTLRRVPVDANTNWHQDGAFLGREARTLNLWLALSPCGRDSPGLDLVARRFDDVVETGTEGALFDWSVSESVVERVAGGDAICRPEFQAGDALLFDHLLLHRTAVEPDMHRERYAIETWFFAPSVYPSGQIPLVI
jgi:hypothetical protein